MKKTDFEKVLVCPVCKIALGGGLRCPSCRARYKFEKGVYLLKAKKLSGGEFKWNKSLFRRNKFRATQVDYFARMNRETRLAQLAQSHALEIELLDLKGLTLDIATGLGGMLRRMLAARTKATIVASDVDQNMMARTARFMRRDFEGFFAVNADAKHLPFADGICDCAAGYAALGNIPDTPAVLREIYRVLKPGGYFMDATVLTAKNGPTHNFAKKELPQNARALVAQFVREDLRKAGFKKIEIREIAKAVWAENPCDILPVAGDTARYSIIKAWK